MLDNNIKRRIVFLFLSFTVLFMLLSIRLYEIMVVESDFAKQAQDRQTYRSIVYYDGFEFKGDIYDTTMKKLTNDGIEHNALILPSIVNRYISGGDSKCSYLLKLICDYNRLNYYDLIRKISKEASGSDQAVVLKVNDRLRSDISDASIPGIYVKSQAKKFGDNVGISILSNFLNNRINDRDIKYDDSVDMKVFNNLSRHVKKIYNVPLDGRGMLMEGMDAIDQTIEDDIDSPVKNVMLTLNYNIQKAAEDTLYEKCDKNCALTVININTGEVLAMASKDRNGWERNMVTYSGDNTAYNPGSLFKIIVASAALENNVADLNTSFLCSGKDDKTGISCHKRDGHGMIGMEDAFANSCNVYFIELARKVGAEKIISMAEKFGLGRKVLNFSRESTGMLYRKKEDIKYDIGNIALGQKDIMITPLQACAMVSAIAGDGIMNHPYILKRIFDRDGIIYEEYDAERERIISEDTAKIVQKLMEEVTSRGTGQKASLECGSAGKTGTAQKGIKDENGEYEKQDSWFAGYFPTENPKYAVSVYIENAEKGSSTAQEIFKSIAQKILILDNEL